MRHILLLTGLLCVLAVHAGANTDLLNGKMGSMNYKIGVDERVRYEYRHNFDYNSSAKDNGSLLFHRLKLNTEISSDCFTFFIEGLDAQTGGYRVKAIASQTDDFDLHQAWLEFKNIADSGFGLKIGRQEIKYGKKRLIDASQLWGNRIRNFDATILKYEHQGLYADMLYAQDVKFDDDKFNQSRNEEFLTGIYAGYQKAKDAPLLETYFLKWVDTKGSNDIQRYTVGAHMVMGLWKGAGLDVEVPLQYGKAGTTTSSKTVHAWAFHVDIAQGFDEVVWKPTLTLSYDQASGDKDPNDSVNNTFVPLYQSTHDPYGLMDFARWQNIINPEVSLKLSPCTPWKLIGQVDLLWLENKSDSWYSSSGSAIRSKTSGDRASFLGTEFSLRSTHELTKNIKVEFGYAHFVTGEYVKDSGPDDNADFFYSQMMVKY